MYASDKAIALIKQFEGLSLIPYKDQAGYWTVGYGHKLRLDETPETITRDHADDVLSIDIAATELALEALLIDCPITQNQIDALVCFVFNVGEEAFAHSELRELVIKGDIDGAAVQFLRWDHIHGEVSLGLAKRRKAEQQLFLTPDELQ